MTAVKETHVPLVENANDASTQEPSPPPANAPLEKASQQSLEEAPRQAPSHDVDLDVGFGFLSDEDFAESVVEGKQGKISSTEHDGKAAGKMDTRIGDEGHNTVEGEVHHDFKDETKHESM